MKDIEKTINLATTQQLETLYALISRELSKRITQKNRGE